MGRRAEAGSAAEAGDSFPHLAMKKCALQGPCPGEVWRPGTRVWGQVPGVRSACTPVGWACALNLNLGFC